LTETNPVIRLDKVSKVYPAPAGDVRALDALTLAVGEGEFVSIAGPSGSGKSTLLSLVGCLDLPTAGDIYLRGRPTRGLSDEDLTLLRRDHIGFLFREGHLLPRLSVLENVEIPLIFRKRARGNRERCTAVLGTVGLSPDRLTMMPEDLSAGEQQRVALARALVNDPEILVCDEPTGNLDSKAGDALMGLLLDLNREGRTILLATHDPRVAGFAGRTIRISDGRIA